MSRPNQGLKERWKTFGKVFLDPMVVVLLVLGILIYVLSLAQTDRAILALFIILLSVVTGLAGGVVAKRWDDIIGQRLLVARGTVAVRSLKLLLSHVNRLERKVRSYRADLEEKLEEDEDQDIVIYHLREISDRCVAVMEEVLSSIDNWTDIVPEANIETQFELLSELMSEKERLEADLEDVTNALGESENASKKQIQKLRSEKSKLKSELSGIRGKLSYKEFAIRPTINSTGAILSSDAELYGSIGRITVAGNNITPCKSCRRPFVWSSEEPSICPHCGTEQ